MGFGNCTEASYNTCAELQLGANNRTSTLNDKSYVDQLQRSGAA
jgi:hypothetical protein